MNARKTVSPIEFWFDFGSTYSYAAALRVADLAGSAGLELHWRPFLLGPIFKAQGWETSPFVVYPVRGRYMWRDVERTCASLGFPFNKPSVFPRNGLLAARVACRFEGEAWVPEFVRRVFRANFVEDREISDPGVVGSVLASLRQPPDVLDEATSPEAKAKLREQTDRAQAMGIFGAPSFTIGGELFWGNDRLEAAVEWARGVAALQRTAG